jgi:putative transposase
MKQKTQHDYTERNAKIKAAGKATREKRKSQVGKTHVVKLHLKKYEEEKAKMMFVEAKWLYNDIIAFLKNGKLQDYKLGKTVQHLDKDRNAITSPFLYLSVQQQQEVIQEVSNALRALSTLKSHGRSVGRLKYKMSSYSIGLKQYGSTYYISDKHHAQVQKLGTVRAYGLQDFFNQKGQLKKNRDLTTAKLLRKADGFYLSITYFETKPKQKTKKKIGIDLGIADAVNYSDGRKTGKIWIGETERHRRLQQKLARQVKYSNGWYRTRDLIRIECLKEINQKDDMANKILHDLNSYQVCMQDELLNGWKKKFGKAGQHSILGRVKGKLKMRSDTCVLPAWVPTTKFCRCGALNDWITLGDREIICPSCGVVEDRDTHSANNMIFLSEVVGLGRAEVTREDWMKFVQVDPRSGVRSVQVDAFLEYIKKRY